MTNPTITNRMKAECIGDFTFVRKSLCPSCVLGDPSDCLCGFEKVIVPWDTCKAIYKRMYSLSPEANEIDSLRKQLDEAKGRIPALMEQLAEVEHQRDRLLYDLGTAEHELDCLHREGGE